MLIVTKRVLLTAHRDWIMAAWLPTGSCTTSSAGEYCCGGQPPISTGHVAAAEQRIEAHQTTRVVRYISCEQSCRKALSHGSNPCNNPRPLIFQVWHVAKSAMHV
jgi:hypothetical protein